MRGAKVEHKLQQVKMLDCFILANEQAAEKIAQMNRENKHGAPRSLCKLHCSCCATQCYRYRLALAVRTANIPVEVQLASEISSAGLA